MAARLRLQRVCFGPWWQYPALMLAAAVDLPPRLINEIFNRVGLARCVLGSWYPEHDPRLLIERVKYALNAHARTLAATFTLNAQRLLRGEHPREMSALRRFAIA